MPSAGRAAIVPRGEWKSGTAYERLDLVKYEDSIYFAKKDVPTGKLPTDTEYWMFGGKTDQSEAMDEVTKIINGDTIAGKAWKDSAGNFINTTYLKKSDLSEHTSTYVNSQSGVHGLRYYQDTLQYYDTSHKKWVEIETSGGGGATKTTLSITTTTFCDKEITATLEGKETLKDVFSSEGLVTFYLKYTGTYLLTCNGYTTQVTTNKVGETIEIEFDDETAKPKIYGFRIDGSLSNPDDMVSYDVQYDGKDVLNKDFTPARMNFDELKFEYGSWKPVLDKWLCPRPCLLAQNGTVYCYLDEDDYTLDTDGNDVTKYLTGEEGLYNAMCEWGKNGKKIWYKIVPDTDDDSSATIYVSDGQADPDFVAWSFYDCNDHLIDHFYTRIYESCFVTTGLYCSRSISNAQVEHATTRDNTEYIGNLNIDPDNPIWEMQTFADKTLIFILMILISKTLDSQAAFGDGVCKYNDTGRPYLRTGTSNDRGMFFGGNDSETTAVKIFGMENLYGNAGEEHQGCCVYNNQVKVKMTYGKADGTAIRGYNLTSEGYKSAYTIENEVPVGYVSKMKFNKYGFFPYKTQGSESTQYCDYMRIKFPNSDSETIPVLYTIDGYKTAKKQFGMFMGSWYSLPDSGNINASLSCRPLAIPVSSDAESEV